MILVGSTKDLLHILFEWYKAFQQIVFSLQYFRPQRTVREGFGKETRRSMLPPESGQLSNWGENSARQQIT